jgi:hypothetical protein
VQAGRNTFTLQEDAKTATITVPEGNYSASAFAITLAQLLTTASPNTLTYAITAPSSARVVNQGKFQYSVSTSDQKTPTQACRFVIGPYLYEQLGFAKDSTQSFTAGALVSANVVSFQLENTLFIHSDIANNGRDDVLIAIFASSTPDYASITYLNPNPPFWSRALTTQTTNSYRFSLTDEDGQLINLNGRNMVFTVLVYKEDDLARKYAQIKLTELASTL